MRRAATRWPKAQLLLVGLLVLATTSPLSAQKGEEDEAAMEQARAQALEELEAERAALEKEMAERLERLREIEEAREEASRAEAEPLALLEEAVSEAAAEAAAGAEAVVEAAAEETRRAVEEARRVRRRGEDQKFAIGSKVVVAENEVANEVFVLGGSIRVDGEVRGGAVAVMGSVVVNGRVRGDVTAVGGDVELGPNAEVTGQVTSVGGEIDGDPDQAAGGFSEVTMGGFDWSFLDDVPRPQRRSRWSMDEWFELFGNLIFVGLTALVAALLLLVAPRATNNVRRTARVDTWRSALLGLAVGLLVIPGSLVLMILLVISIIGIPFLLLVPFVYLFFVLAWVFGYAGTALAAGQVVRGRGVDGRAGLVTLFVGVVALSGLGLVGDFLDAVGLPWFIHGMFGFSGLLIQLVASCVALGAVCLSRLGQQGPPAPANLPPLPGR